MPRALPQNWRFLRMRPNTSAGRLLDLFERAQPAAGNKAAVESWAFVFEIDGASGNERDHEVARLLTLAGDQFTALRVAAKRAGMQQGSLARIEAAEQFVSVRLQGANWDQSVKQQLTNANLAVLQICSGFLPEEEERISADALTGTKETIVKLLVEIDNADLPDAVKAFLRRQVGLMARAVREYPIRGAAAFRDASDASAADWGESASYVAPYIDTPEVKSVRSLWTGLDKIVARAILYGHLAQLMWSGVSPLLRTAVEHRLLTPAVAELVQPLLGSGTDAADGIRKIAATRNESK